MKQILDCSNITQYKSFENVQLITVISHHLYTFEGIDIKSRITERSLLYSNFYIHYTL